MGAIMMREQIFLGGAPVVGFGDADLSVANPMFFVPILGIIGGAAGGALLGHKKGGVAAAAGAVVGGLVGGAGGIMLVSLVGRRAIPTTTPKTTSTSTTPASSTGEIYAISLSGVPATAGVDDVGAALAHAMAWNMDTLEDGVLSREGQMAFLTIGFKSNATTPPLPSVNFSFKVGEVYATVTAVTRAPAKVQ
jgi:hypothetical protein